MKNKFWLSLLKLLGIIALAIFISYVVYTFNQVKI